MLDPSEVDELAAGIADGELPAWDAVESRAVDESDRQTIAKLRAIAAVGRMFATLSGRVDSRRPARRRLSPGDTWGTLRILGHIGRGRFGDVYRAWDAALDREVALKILPSSRSPEAIDVELVEEGRLMARVHHPNVVAVHGARHIGNEVGLWMELVKGRTLAADLGDRGPFGAEELTRIGIDLCRALGAVHEVGLVHRDVKPQNVLRDERGRIVLGDFGTGSQPSSELDAPVGLVGTPAYLAPEIYEGRPATPSSDLYSLGTLLFHLASRAFPVAGGSIAALRAAHTRGQRSSLRLLRPDLPANLCDVIERAVAADPARRFPDAAAMAFALERVSGPAGVTGRRGIGAAAVVLSLSFLVGTLWVARREPVPVPFEARDWVLVTAFDNRTGEPLLDGTLERALERELSNSSFVNVVPRERLNDALVLMRKPVETQVTAQVGREVALRDGQIRVLLAGHVEKVGSAYTVTAQILRPRDGAVAASVSETVPDAAGLMGAMRRASAKVRARLGESMAAIQPPDDRLQTATTASLRALQLYSEGFGLLRGEGTPRQPAAAEALLREAVALDPDFALAHLALAEAIRASAPVGNPRHADADESLARALEASARSVEAERLFVVGKVAQTRAAQTQGAGAPALSLFAQAAAAHEALLQLQPEHFGAVGELANTYRRLGRVAEANRLVLRLAELRPNSASAHVTAASSMYYAGERERARHHVRHVRALGTPLEHLSPSAAAWLITLDAQEAWLGGDLTQALSVADIVAAGIDDVPADRRGQLELFVASLYLTLGRLDQAEQLLSPPGREDRVVRLGMVLSAREDRSALATFLLKHAGDMTDVGWRVGSFWIEAGLLGKAREAIAINPVSTYVGQLALAEGRYDEAIAHLRERLGVEVGFGSPGIYRVRRKLAEALSAAGRADEAVAILEDMSRAMAIAGPPNGYEWLRARERLASLYRQTGRVSDAEAVEAELLQLLAVADDDHPIKRRLEHRGATGTGVRD